ncbi:MAG: NAD-dependent epimerase/dehydratase family protein [Steroidobacteraceae bacterium]
MRVLVAGATGAIGPHVVRRLVAAGHYVVGLTRSADKAAAVRSVGAEAVLADALEPAEVRSAVAFARPDVIVHEMTALRSAVDLRRFDRNFELTNRLRTEGLDNLLEAGRQCGTSRIIAQSFCGWPYARSGGHVKTEGDPLEPDPPRQLRRTLEAIRYLENRVLSSGNMTGLVLRYAAFYGPRTGILEPNLIAQVQQRRFPQIGSANGWWSFVHIDDAAAATAIAVERGPCGIYNIADDDPAPVNVWLPALAAMLGAGPPRRIPAWLGRVLAGEHVVTMMTEVRAGSNSKARQVLGWQPVFKSWRSGFVQCLREQLGAQLEVC